MLARGITKFVEWAVGRFYDIGRTGPMAPDGPVLIAANHPNALVDPLVIFRTAGRPSRPLAKAPLFEKAVFGTVLKGLGGLPVYRREDDTGLMHLNEQTFDAAIDALHQGDAVQIYPEGNSHSEPSLTPFRTGAARIALLAEARRDWNLGLVIQPVGLTYARKHLFRGSALASFGDPIPVVGYRERFETDERATVRELTDLIQDRLEGLTLTFEHPEDAELVDVSERLYARQKRLARPRERQQMVERMPRLQGFARGLRRLRASDPKRLARLQAGVRRYLRLLTLFGAKDGDVPARYPLRTVLRYALPEVAFLVLILPVALVGIAAWYPPFETTRIVAPRFRPKLDQLATYKLGTALMAFPVWYVVLTAGAYWLGGLRLAGVALVALPITGVAASAWRDRQAAVREDVRVFLRAVRSGAARDRLAEQRDELVAEFDALIEMWRQERERRATAGGEFPETPGPTATAADRSRAGSIPTPHDRPPPT